MTAGPKSEDPEPAATIPTVKAIVAPVPRRLPVRLHLLSYRTPSGRTESQVYRQLPAALRHAERLTSQGLSATVSVGTVGSWSTATFLPAVPAAAGAGR